ncbi:hypothetical protein [Paraburkholderia madseniana]|uniref:hypothetical protein n=1 Tax=Paraburkholderia madseniana TaxID=2599607 RepID=UPI002D805EA9|nr:hypothetical protein [Paraburkholderia madseniana]
MSFRRESSESWMMCSKTGEQMLKVTVELWPGGRESGRRVIATADIVRIKNGVLADYEVDLREDLLGEVGEASTLRSYPRWSASVWDLVARSIAAALNDGNEQLPARPPPPDIPVHESDGLRYVRLREIPEPTRTFFRGNLAYSARPVVEGDPEPMDCAYAWDLQDFLVGAR